MDFKLNLTILKFTHGTKTAHQSGLLSGKGNIFEQKLQQLACVTGKTICNNTRCTSYTSCAVSTLTARRLSTDPQLVQQHQKPGLPYVFSSFLPFDNHPANCFYLLLLGDALKHIPLLEQVVFSICGDKTNISTLDYQLQSMPLLVDKKDFVTNLPLLDLAELVMQAGMPVATPVVQVDLLTPLRLNKNGRELNRFDASQFIRATLRRFSSLVAHYGEKIDVDRIKYLAQIADDVHIDHYQPVKMAGQKTVRGVTGRYLLKNLHGELIPYLLAGSLFNLGKGASYGMGTFRINHG